MKVNVFHYPTPQHESDSRPLFLNRERAEMAERTWGGLLALAMCALSFFADRCACQRRDPDPVRRPAVSAEAPRPSQDAPPALPINFEDLRKSVGSGN